jgi:hypothetical protein
MHDELILAAYRHMVLNHACSADDILVTPELREQFVVFVLRKQNRLTEKFILRRLIYLRKKSRLPRSRSLITSQTWSHRESSDRHQ